MQQRNLNQAGMFELCFLVWCVMVFSCSRHRLIVPEVILWETLLQTAQVLACCSSIMALGSFAALDRIIWAENCSFFKNTGFF